jgi:hypothetical protein
MTASSSAAPMSTIKIRMGEGMEISPGDLQDLKSGGVNSTSAYVLWSELNCGRVCATRKRKCKDLSAGVHERAAEVCSRNI